MLKREVLILRDKKAVLIQKRDMSGMVTGHTGTYVQLLVFVFSLQKLLGPADELSPFYRPFDFINVVSKFGHTERFAFCGIAKQNVAD